MIHAIMIFVVGLVFGALSVAAAILCGLYGTAWGTVGLCAALAGWVFVSILLALSPIEMLASFAVATVAAAIALNLADRRM